MQPVLSFGLKWKNLIYNKEKQKSDLEKAQPSINSNNHHTNNHLKTGPSKNSEEPIAEAIELLSNNIKSRKTSSIDPPQTKRDEDYFEGSQASIDNLCETEEEYILEGLRRIGRACQSRHQNLTIKEIKLSIEQLDQTLSEIEELNS